MVMYMSDYCMVAVHERSLYGGCIREIIVWWLYMRDRCLMAVYERSLYGGCI